MYKIRLLDKKTGKQAYGTKDHLYQTKTQFLKWYSIILGDYGRFYKAIAFKWVGGKWKPI